MPHIFHITYREINLYEQKTIHSRTYTYVCMLIVIYVWDLVFDGNINLRHCALQIMTIKKFEILFDQRMISKYLIELKNNVVQVLWLSVQ